MLEDIQPVIDGLAEQVALIDRDGTILAVNRQWHRQVEKQARHGLHISRDYDAFLAELVAEGDDGARPILEAFREIRKGSKDSFSCLYHGVGTFNGYQFKVVMTAMPVHGERYVMVSVLDVTQIASLKRQRRRLGSQLLHAQEAERRRMARDLHDSTAQALVALQMNLQRLSREYEGPAAEAVVAECREAIQEVHREIRALSFIAHPPSPAAKGLEDALESLAAGYAKRAGFEVEIQCSDVGAASASVEATIYRVAQEGLSNGHRHGLASRVQVRLAGTERYLHLLMTDDGVGFDPPVTNGKSRLGVGVRGMTERVRELGGRLILKRLPKGTLLWAVLPRIKADAARAELRATSMPPQASQLSPSAR